MGNFAGKSHTREKKSTNSEAAPATSTNASMTASEPESNNFFEDEADLYEAAKKGEIATLTAYETSLEYLENSTKNTILHIYLAAISSDEPDSTAAGIVRKMVDTWPSLLSKADTNGDIPLHIVAANGYKHILDILIEKASKHGRRDPENGEGSDLRLLNMTNKKKDTALHAAARNNHADVAKVLIDKDPNLQNLTNDCEETPLYLAAEGGNSCVVETMLESCTPLAYRGPSGKTALHAAVLAGSLIVVQKILEKQKSLGDKADTKGWTPLHYAAYMGFFLIVEAILKTNKSVAYSVDNARKMTALHLAACQGHYWAAKEIISKCPDCCRLVDTKGWNVLHYAAASKSDSAIKLILENPALRYLIEQKDIKGNTPIHLLLASCSEEDIKIVYGSLLNLERISALDVQFKAAPQLKSEVQEWMEDLGDGPLGKIPFTREVLWKDKKTTEDVIPGLLKSNETPLTVGTLIATVTFAAAFTFPGGLRTDIEDTNRGTAILSKNIAFQTFVITDTIAMMLSASSILTHCLLTTLMRPFRQGYELLLSYRALSILFAEIFMVIAFVTGTYAMLTPSLWLAITTCLIGSIFLVYSCYMTFKIMTKLT